MSLALKNTTRSIPSVKQLIRSLIQDIIFYSQIYWNQCPTVQLTMSPASLRIYRTSAFSRERNRMHARKTRQRKKEHMQKLQDRVDELKHEQVRIKQAISEKNTEKATVRPNCSKYWPGIPPMKETGTKTAMMVKVVAITARPISSAASIAAW